MKDNKYSMLNGLYKLIVLICCTHLAFATKYQIIFSGEESGYILLTDTDKNLLHEFNFERGTELIIDDHDFPGLILMQFFLHQDPGKHFFELAFAQDLVLINTPIGVNGVHIDQIGRPENDASFIAAPDQGAPATAPINPPVPPQQLAEKFTVQETFFRFRKF